LREKPLSPEKLGILDKPIENSTKYITWALDEVDTSTAEQLSARRLEVQNECLLHISMLIGILNDDHEFEFSVPFEIPDHDGCPWPMDKFAQPDVLVIPIRTTIESKAIMSGLSLESKELWTLTCCICLTCLMLIYHQVGKNDPIGLSFKSLTDHFGD
jgi:hypothetical protein